MKKLILLLALSLTICGKSFGWDVSGYSGDLDYDGNSCGESYAASGISHCRVWMCIGYYIDNYSQDFMWAYAGCDTCEDGYIAYFTGNSIEGMDIMDCQKYCSYTISCSIANGSGAQYLVSETPDCTYGACTLTSCNNGYYKNGNTCTACPAIIAGISVASKNGGRNGVSDCYVTGTSSNASGTFEISGTDCTY